MVALFFIASLFSSLKSLSVCFLNVCWWGVQLVNTLKNQLSLFYPYMHRLLLCQACICSRKSDRFGEADEQRAWTCQHRPWSEGNYLCYSWAASLNNNCLFEIIYYMNLYYHFILAYFTILSTSFSIIIIPSCFHCPTVLSSIIEWIMFICHSCNWSPKVSTKYLNSSIWSLPS